MSKRYKRTLVSHTQARAWKLAQAFAGSDHANMAGNCQRPVIRSFTGLRDHAMHRVLAQGAAVMADPFLDLAGGQIITVYGDRPRDPVPEAYNVPINVDVAVRCRRCPACLKARSNHWRLRALAEWERSARTWFGTLTATPEAHWQNRLKVDRRLAVAGVSFDSLCPADQFRELHKGFGAPLSLMLKRIRKNSGVQLRYMIVAEAHKSGLPHYHLLLHEVDEPVRHAVLAAAWEHGFSNWKLVRDKNAAGYITKYLAKSALARVRASKSYGPGVDASQPGNECNDERSISTPAHPGCSDGNKNEQPSRLTSDLCHAEQIPLDLERS